MELEAIGGEAAVKKLIYNIRSSEEEVRKQTISQIPTLILESLKNKNDVLNQLLLVIYNLTSTDTEQFEILNASNRTLVTRHLMRLYAESINNHQHTQIVALTKIIELVHSSELLVELAYVLHQCSVSKLGKEDSDLIDEALGAIQDKAAANLFPEALLMIHSILAIK